MGKTDEFDLQAIARAKEHMGKVAWPTVVLGLLLSVSYVATVAASLVGMLSLWLAVPLLAAITYLSYTVLHESVHGSIAVNDPTLRWLNRALGYMAAWVTMFPFTAHRYEHMAHHRYANDDARDPDFHVGRMCESPLALVRAALRAWVSQFAYCGKNRWNIAPTSEKWLLGLEICAALIPRLAVIAAGYWIEGLALFVIAWLVGATVLLYLFAYVVHQPHEQVGRYVDTSTILLPGPLNWPLTWLWMYQNYHSIHHLFPRVPFYKYARLYTEIEAVMEEKQAPIYRISVLG